LRPLSPLRGDLRPFLEAEIGWSAEFDIATVGAVVGARLSSGSTTAAEVSATGRVLCPKGTEEIFAVRLVARIARCLRTLTTLHRPSIELQGSLSQSVWRPSSGRDLSRVVAMLAACEVSVPDKTSSLSVVVGASLPALPTFSASVPPIISNNRKPTLPHAGRRLECS
jgi:hypothetical protein